MIRIQQERRRRAIFFSLGAIASIIALVPAFKAFWTDITQSGLTQILSLIFSDFTTIAVWWKDFAFSVLEVLPVLSLAALLASLFVFLGSIKYLVRDITAIFTPRHLIN